MKPHRLHYAVVKEQQLYFKYEPVSIAGLKKAYKTHGVIRLRNNTLSQRAVLLLHAFILCLRHKDSRKDIKQDSRSPE